MSDPALQTDRTVPSYTIKLNGAKLPVEVALDVLDVSVSEYFNGSNFFCIHINNCDSDSQELKYSDGDVFSEGGKVEILFGFEDKVKSLIKGEITAFEPLFHQDSVSTYKIQGYDSLHRFRRGRKTYSYLKMKDSDIASKIASSLILTAQTKDTGIVHDYILQHNQTDIDFLMQRAKRINYELNIEDGKLLFLPSANDKGKVVTIRYGYTLLSFYPRLSTINQVSEIQVKGWDPITKKPILGKAQKGDEVSKMSGKKTGAQIAESAFFNTQQDIVNMPIFSKGEADQIAKGKFNEMSISFIKGEGSCIGNTDIRAGKVIQLEGLGKRFSGLYYVTSATHIIDTNGYITQFTAERNAA